MKWIKVNIFISAAANPGPSPKSIIFLCFLYCCSLSKALSIEIAYHFNTMYWRLESILKIQKVDVMTKKFKNSHLQPSNQSSSISLVLPTQCIRMWSLLKSLQRTLAAKSLNTFTEFTFRWFLFFKINSWIHSISLLPLVLVPPTHTVLLSMPYPFPFEKVAEP